MTIRRAVLPLILASTAALLGACGKSEPEPQAPLAPEQAPAGGRTAPGSTPPASTPAPAAPK